MADKKPAPKSPDRAAVDALAKVIRDSRNQNAKRATTKEPPPPDSLPENWGLGDLVRVGKSRLSRAVYGPPEKGKQ